MVLSCIQNTSNSAYKDELDYIPDGIVLDITLVKGQRVVTVRSPVQVCIYVYSVYCLGVCFIKVFQ